MKNNNSIMKSSAGALSRLGRVLSMLVAFTLFSVGAYANTFYVSGANTTYSDNRTQMTNTGTNTYTATIAITASTNFKFKIVENSGSDTYWSNNGSNQCSMDNWEFYTTTSDPCTFYCSTGGDYTFTWNSQYHKLSITSGTPAPTTYTWYLAGKFTDWGTNKIQFTGTDNTLTCTKVFEANYSLSGCSATDGFKIVRNNGSADTWLGIACTTVITSSNNSATFSTSKSDNNNTCGITCTLAGTYTFTLNISDANNPVLTVIYPQPKAKTYIGTAPVVTPGTNAIVRAYIKATGCNTVDKIRAYYSDSEFNDAPDTYVEITGTYERGSDNPITLTASALDNVIAGEGLVHVKVAAHTNNDLWSDLSDEICFMWTGCQNPTVTVTPPAQTAVTPFDQFTITADAACNIGDIEWSYSSTSTLVAAPIMEASAGGSVLTVKIPRPAGTVGLKFNDIYYTFTATVKNGDKTATGSCQITLTDAEEDCTKP